MEDNKVFWAVWYRDKVNGKVGPWKKHPDRAYTISGAKLLMREVCARHYAVRVIRREPGGVDRFGPIVPHWRAYHADVTGSGVPKQAGDRLE